MRAAAIAAVALLAISVPATAGDEELRATRADLARAFLRFERAWRDHPPEPERLAAYNGWFDSLTRSFFLGRLLGRYDGIVSAFDRLTERLEGGEVDPDVRFARTLKVAIDPPVLVPGATTPPLTLRWAPMYRAKGAETPSLDLEVRIVGPKGTVRFARRLLGAASGAVLLKLTGPLTLGAYRVEVAGEEVGRLLVLERSFDARREENAGRLAKVVAKTDEMRQALASCRARNALVADRPDDDRLVWLLLDPVAHADAVESEVAALVAGKNPYRGRIGETWRVLALDKTEVPLTVYAPEAARGEAPLPLVIALHGMGGNESMFLHGYGAGRLRELADERGFLVAAPRTERFSVDAFDLLLETLRREYRIDDERVYLLGHSLGAGRAVGLCRYRKGIIAAACLIAGVGLGVPELPPTLEIWGERDRIMRFAVERARSKPIDGEPDPLHPRRFIPNQGHTLVVGAVLPDALTWLLCVRLPPR